MSAQSAEDVTRLAQDLVYKVAYAYYDAPYILLLKLLIQLGPYVSYASPKRVRKLKLVG